MNEIKSSRVGIEKSDSKPTEYKKDADNIITNKGYYLVPSTLVKTENKEFLLDWDGIIEWERVK